MGPKTDNNTKIRLVAAALKVLAEQGYHKTSMKEIAREAGVAQGLINYYFPSKDDLMFEVFQMESLKYAEEMQRIADIPKGEHFIRHALEVPKGMVNAYPDWHRLRYELFAIGLRSEAGRQKIKESLAAGRRLVHQSLDTFSNNDHVNKSALASIINVVIDGLALELMADPNYDIEAAYLTFAELLEAYLSKGRR